MIKKFISNLQKYNPQFNIKYKKESILMKIIGFVLFFNKTFISNFATTINQTVYLPNNDFLSTKQLEMIVLLAHEYVHTKDAKKFGTFFYTLIYLFPLWLSLLAVPFYFIIGWWSLLFLLFLSPLPAPGRAFIEFRGYTMSLFMIDVILKEKNNVDINYMLSNEANKIESDYFHSAAYYFMWIFGMRNKFDDVLKKIKSGDILKEDEVFQEVLDAYKNSI